LTRQIETEVLPPAPNRVRPVKLKTVGDILAEMQRLYCGARSGNLPVEDLTRLIFALEKIRGTVEATQVIDHIPGKPGPYDSQIDVTGIPSDWAVIGLLGDQAHVPRTILPRLRELLPPDAFTPLPDYPYRIPSTTRCRTARGRSCACSMAMSLSSQSRRVRRSARH
jgi:hypothetical protein